MSKTRDLTTITAHDWNSSSSTTYHTFSSNDKDNYPHNSLMELFYNLGVLTSAEHTNARKGYISLGAGLWQISTSHHSASSGTVTTTAATVQVPDNTRVSTTDDCGHFSLTVDGSPVAHAPIHSVNLDPSED